LTNTSILNTSTLRCNLTIEHAIPSINIFPLDLVYGYGDTIAEYDYLVFARASCSDSSQSKLLLLVEEFKDVNRELHKIVRDVCLNQFTIVRIQHGNGERLNHYTPLCLNIPGTVTQYTSSIHDTAAKYPRIYWVGYELYLLLYYLVLYVKPEVLDRDYTKYLKIPLHKTFKPKTVYDYYIKCYNEHVEAINSYRLDVKDNYSITNLINCINEFIEKLDKVKREPNFSPIDKIRLSLNGVKRIVLLVLPQLHMVLDSRVLGEEFRGYISRRVDFQRQAIKAIHSLLCDICGDVRTYIVAFNWRSRLGEHFEKYVNRLCKGIENIKLCEYENSQEGKELSLSTINQREVDRETGLVILILGDYWKPGIQRVLSHKWRTERKLLIIIPETCYIPSRLDSTTTSRTVKAENVYNALKEGRDIYNTLTLFSHRIYIKCLN